MPYVKPDRIEHETNLMCDKEVEVFVGADNIVRINIDGVCALRIRMMSEGCTVAYEDHRYGWRKRYGPGEWWNQ